METLYLAQVGLTPDQIVSFLTQGGVPAVMFLMWWLERKERLRLQRVLEGFLPMLTGTRRAFLRVNQVVGADDEPAEGPLS